MAVLIMHSPRGGSIDYHDWLASLDEDLFLLCSSEHEPDPSRYSHIALFDDYEVNGAVEATALDLFERRGYRLIVAKAECDLMRAGHLRDVLHLPGQSSMSARAYRDKVIMKSFIEKAGITTPSCRRLDDTIDLLEFVGVHGYPVVVKPVDGSGSLGVTALNDRSELDRFVGRALPSNYEVEQLVEGCIYHVDGLVLDGEVVVAQPSRYIPAEGALAIRTDRAYGSYFLDATPFAQRLGRFAKDVIGALPSPSCFTFHLELFHRTDGQLVFCEIASRTGGVLIARMLRHGLGLEFDELWVKAQAGIMPNPAALRSVIEGAVALAGRIVFPPRCATLLSLPSAAPPWIAEYRCRIAPGTTIGRAAYDNRKTGDYVAGCIVLGRSESEVEQRLMEAAAWFEEEVRWDRA